MTKLLRRREVEALTGLSRATIYRLKQRGQFPRPVRIGADSPNGAVRWCADDIEAWLESRRAETATAA